MWAIVLTYTGAPSEDDFVRWGDALDATVAAIPRASRWTVTLYQGGSDTIGAARAAAARVHKVVSAVEPVAVEILDEEDYIERAEQPTIPRPGRPGGLERSARGSAP